MKRSDEAVLLAAGRGTRMRELTADLPKPRIEVRGKPVLQRIVDGLRDAGVRYLLASVGPGAATSPWYNAGLYAFRPSIFNFTAKLQPAPRGEYELPAAIRELAQSGQKVRALELTGEWADVRDPETLARLNR